MHRNLSKCVWGLSVDVSLRPEYLLTFGELYTYAHFSYELTEIDYRDPRLL